MLLEYPEMICYYRLHIPPGKPGNLLFTFPELENAWNLLQKWENLEFYFKTWKKTFKLVNSVFQDSLFKISTQTLSFKTKLTRDSIGFAWKIH